MERILAVLTFMAVLYSGYDAQLTSSLGRFTFCPGENVTVSCNLSSTQNHVWDVVGLVEQRVLVPEQLGVAVTVANFIFGVTSTGDNGAVTGSTLTFVAITDVIANGTEIRCSNNVETVPGRQTEMETVNLFGRTSPPQMPLVNNTIGNYTSVVITFEQPVYGHECATGYSAEFDQRSERSITTTILVSRLNLCKVTYTFSIFALTSSGVNGEPVSANSSVPDFADLGMVFNLSVSGGILQWNRPPNAHDDCISCYTVEWPSGNSVVVQGDVREIAVDVLNRRSNNTLPFCVNVSTTVSPKVGVLDGPLRANQNDPPKELLYQHPNLSSPVIMLPGGGTNFDTNVTWQPVSSLGFGNNITVFVDAYDRSDGQCNGMEVTDDSISRLFPSNCSSAGSVVQYCVAFQYMQCRKISILSRQLPPVNSTNVMITTTASTFTIKTTLGNLNGRSCTANQLRVQTIIFRNNFMMEVDTRTTTFVPGSYEATFSSLSSNTEYEYRISVMEGDRIIANYTGRASTDSTNNAATIIAVVVVLAVVFLLGVAVGIGIGVYCYIKNRGSKKEKGDDQELHRMEEDQDQKEHTDASPIVHEKAPTGDEYAVVDHNSQKKNPTADLYQDPASIQHETAPTGDLYAVTEKKPKKGSKKGPSEEELSAMYSTPDVTKKNQKQALTYASLDMPNSSGSTPGQQLPQTEYASVVN